MPEIMFLTKIFSLAFVFVGFLAIIYTVRTGIHWIACRPKHKEFVLGDDMRGRYGVIEDIGADEEHITIRVGTERWRAEFRGKEKPAIGSTVKITGLNGLTLQTTRHGR